MVEELRERSQRALPSRSARHNSATGHRVVPLEGLGLHAQEGDHDDQAFREAAQHSNADKFLELD